MLSSHLMSEMQLVADHLLVIGQGRILADTSMADFMADSSDGLVIVDSPDAGALALLLTATGGAVTSPETNRLEIRELTADAIGETAATHGMRLHSLIPVEASLETAYLNLTRDSVEYTSTVPHVNHSHSPISTDARRAA